MGLLAAPRRQVEEEDTQIESGAVQTHQSGSVLEENMDPAETAALESNTLNPNIGFRV